MRYKKDTSKLAGILCSVVALSLMLVLFFTSTYSWLTNQISANLNAGSNSNKYISIDPDSGLEMNYGQEDNNEGIIDINDAIKEPSTFKLYECSSLDGRRFFFPLSQYNTVSPGDKEFVSDAETDDFLFREATAADKNTKYISVNLTLHSKTDTPVYLHNDTKITGGAANAVRVAFIENEINGKSVVFDNTDEPEYVQYSYSNTITKLDSTGRVIGNKYSDSDTLHSFQEYAFDNAAGNVLFNLKAGVKKNITVNIWLEGTDSDCTEDIVDFKDLFVHIIFSTTKEDEITYFFVDHTASEWVYNEDCNLYAITDSGKLKRPMTFIGDPSAHDYTWTVSLPASTKSIKFARYDPSKYENTPTEWNTWEAGEVGSCTTYVALAHNTGIWYESTEIDHLLFLDGDSQHTILDNRSEFGIYVSYTVTDGNGNDIDFRYKLDDKWQHNKWAGPVPSGASDIIFEFGDDDGATIMWEAYDRGNNLYFTVTDAYGRIGYWSNKLLCVDGASYVDTGYPWDNEVIFVAFFFGDCEETWTTMFATTDKGRFIAAAPDGATGVVFCRYENGAGFGWDWPPIYNQTPNSLEDFGTNNLLKITGYDSEGYYLKGTWYYSDDP